MPESPRWLGLMNEDERCLESLSYVYDDIDSEKQHELIRYEISRIEQVSYFGGIKQLGTTYKRCIIAGSMLRVFKQFLGMSIFLQYGPEIMIDSGESLQNG